MIKESNPRVKPFMWRMVCQLLKSSRNRNYRLAQSLKIEFVKNQTRKYSNTAESIHFSRKQCLITYKNRRCGQSNSCTRNTDIRVERSKKVCTYLSPVFLSDILEGMFRCLKRMFRISIQIVNLVMDFEVDFDEAPQ